MAWNYLNVHEFDDAIDRIRNGILRFNAKNSDKISFGYSETITVFYAKMVHQALKNCSPDARRSFEVFLETNSHLLDRNLPLRYYSKEIFASEQAKKSFVPPDLNDF